jgi:sRNA-binding protein
MPPLSGHLAPGWPKPLAIGIHHTILADLGCDPKVLHVAMHIWSSQPGYLANTVDMTYRYGLDGTPGTELTAEDRANAAKRLDAIQAALKLRAKQRRAAPS